MEKNIKTNYKLVTFKQYYHSKNSVLYSRAWFVRPRFFARPLSLKIEFKNRV